MLKKLISGMGALLLALGLLAGCDRTSAPAAPKFKAQDIHDVQFAQDFRLLDPTGTERTLADWRGKVVLIFFGYTQCPDVCPTALSRAATVMELLGKDAERVQVLFVTVDPERDTPEILAEYAPVFHPSFMGLYTTPAATPQLAKDFRVFYRINPGSTPTTYTIDHSVTTYAYDPEGRLRLAIGHDASAEDVVHDIRLLLGTPAQ